MYYKVLKIKDVLFKAEEELDVKGSSQVRRETK